MTNIVITLEDNTQEAFDNTIGHQVGYGAAQIMMDNGEQIVFNNFKKLVVELTEEEQKDFIATQENAKKRAEEQVAAQEAAYEAQMKANEAKKGAAPELTVAH